MNKLLKLYFFLKKSEFNNEAEKIEKIIKTSASKFNALRNLGLSDETSRQINDICKGLSIWFTYKMIDYDKKKNGWDEKYLISQIDKDFNWKFSHAAVLVMDFIKYGPEGIYNKVKGEDLGTIIDKAQEWKNEFDDSGGGNINYIEKNKIILDFRDENGLGFYWADLATDNSKEECDRMGHCGKTTSNATLYSLRENKKIGQRFYLNKSILTASITNKGVLQQIKAGGNSRPDDWHFPYILSLIMFKANGENLVKDLGVEYGDNLDFSFFDLDSEILKMLKEHNKNLLNSILFRLALLFVGGDRTINKEEFKYNINLDNDLLFKILKYAIDENEGDSDGFINDIISMTFSEDKEIKEIDFDRANYFLDNYYFKSVIDFIKDIDESNKDLIISYIGSYTNINKSNFIPTLTNYYLEDTSAPLAESINLSLFLSIKNEIINQIRNKVSELLSKLGVVKITGNNISLTINIYDLLEDSNEPSLLEGYLSYSVFKNSNNIGYDFLSKVFEEGEADMCNIGKIKLDFDTFSPDISIFNEKLKMLLNRLISSKKILL